MGYSRRNYGYGGGYDRGGRWRSEAWHMDGGANDGGWHHRYCNMCCAETEHVFGTVVYNDRPYGTVSAVLPLKYR